MNPIFSDVLSEVRSRVEHLRVVTDAQMTEPGWIDCDSLRSTDLDEVIDAVGDGDGRDRQVAVSLLAQSYAHRVASISLAAFAIGLPWPSPAAMSTSVRLADGRAKALRYRGEVLGERDDAPALVRALFDTHLIPFVATVRESQRLGERLVWSNVAASCAAAFRAVEGAARDRGDDDERQAIRRRGSALIGASPILQGTGHFAASRSDWMWQRSACCLWYRTSGGRTCEGCSLNVKEEDR